MKRAQWMAIATCIAFGVCGLVLVAQEANRKAPAIYRVKFETTCGDFVIEVQREWAPRGADRFYQLVKAGYYDDCQFFRVRRDFMVQFGINGDPKVSEKWERLPIKDDPIFRSNKRGFVTYAKQPLPNTRTTQVFINYVDNSAQLDSRGFAPFGQVIEGMEFVDKINDEYGDDKVDQGILRAQGNAYLKSKFPNLDGIKKATLVEK